MSEEGVTAFLTEKYGSLDQSVKPIDNGSESITVYRWKDGEASGAAHIKDGLLIRITISEPDRAPTLGQIVSNLGEPTDVVGFVEAREKALYTVGLDFVEKGVSVYSSGLKPVDDVRHEDQWAVLLKETMRVNFVTCYEPGSLMEEVLRDSHFTAPQDIQAQLERRSPWPGFGQWISLEAP